MELDNPVFASTKKLTKCINDKASLVANIAKLVSEANSNRGYGLYINVGTVPITLVLGDTTNAAIGKGIPLLPYGSYKIGQDNLYIGKISAIASAAAELSYVECSL